MLLAAAATLGILLDRYYPNDIPWTTAGAISVVLGIIFVVAYRPADRGWLLILCFFFAGGAYHHYYRWYQPADSLSHQLHKDPVISRVRGVVIERPVYRKLPARFVENPNVFEVSTTLRIDATHLQVRGDWLPVSGGVQVRISGELTAVTIGDEIELFGWLAPMAGPLNPGEFDWANRYADQLVVASMQCKKTPDAAVRLVTGNWSLQRSLNQLQSSCRTRIEQHFQKQPEVAIALLLGDGTAMSQDEWQQYIRTGVIHVLAISGQHLVVLSFFLWCLFRLFPVAPGKVAFLVATTVTVYALMTGARPSAMRAAIMVSAVCSGIIFRRSLHQPNIFAFAWLLVLVLQPTDLFTPGFQLSFVCVALLCWGIPDWGLPNRNDADIMDENPSLFWLGAKAIGRWLARMYMITLVLSLCVMPLTLAWQHLCSPVGILIGPVAIVLTSLALIMGFLFLILSPLGIVEPFAWITENLLILCQRLVHSADGLPGGVIYAPSPPSWWLIGFYVLLAVLLLARHRLFIHLISAIPSRLLCVGLLGAWFAMIILWNRLPHRTDELQVTFLAVDHGSCVVMRTPDDRIFLYDAGSSVGSPVARNIIAPYLWSQGVAHIDEIFLSHADLDHYNGLPDLIERFPIGQISLTPSFREKPSALTEQFVQLCERYRIPIRTLQAGDHLEAGVVQLDVLHPPQEGPGGVENVRSLVLQISQQNRPLLLLTGDLEGPGISDLAEQPPRAMPMMMVPHHGSLGRDGQRPLQSGPAILARWCTPQLAISSQGRGDAGKAIEAMQALGVPYWSTWPMGAISVRVNPTGIVVESFASNERVVLPLPPMAEKNR
ncbi:MAG: ComEC/Rec2 family competence protein [Zavarzinella sp.]